MLSYQFKVGVNEDLKLGNFIFCCLIEKLINLLLNKLVYKQSPPLIFLDFNEKFRIWSLKSGLEVRLINEMSKYFNFSMKIIECNNDWGIQLPNKTWSGIIGKIVSKVQFYICLLFPDLILFSNN